ncbi:hypothetical protein BJX99DRAFT_235948 [Aspergillus californicus]
MGMSGKEAADTEQKNSGDHPPEYAQHPEQPLRLPTLDLKQNAGLASDSTVTNSECIAHLKFLAALSDLRDTVTNTADLFDIPDPSPREFDSSINEAWALVKEKRWAIYTAKAVDRYTAWFNKCTARNPTRPTTDMIYSPTYDTIAGRRHPLVWNYDGMPPLDVLMVWHAHMLNPRSFLEDCIRYGKMRFWFSGFPWEVINACIDDQTLVYDAGRKTGRLFLSKTGYKIDSLKDRPVKSLQCPSCGFENSAPWTRGKLTLPLGQTFDSWHGFTDKNFKIACAQCSLQITHETLRVQKFRTDVEALLTFKYPMPGTLYDLRGVPQRQGTRSRKQQEIDFPNRLIRASRGDLRQYMKSRMWSSPSVSMLRDLLEFLMQNKDNLNKANPTAVSPKALYKAEKVAFRRMMSRYWDNSSQFALDLVGAVIRQGTFIQKMDNIDWLHSPTLTDTVHRLIRKYTVFFKVMSSNPNHMAVPTLDVDLAWHTHQLSPGRYYEYSIFQTAHNGKHSMFIDHDDKVSEIKLSDGFEWTSKMYRKLTNGGIYSECTCWYCEAVRGPDLHGRIFQTPSGAKARLAAANLHDDPTISSHPDKNPHISAHSAIKAQNSAAFSKGINVYQTKFLKLRSEYERARRRADKRNNRTGGKTSEKQGSASKDDVYTTYPLMWGYPVYVPYYGPYTSDPSVHSDAYAADPSCNNLHPGAPGACATGTCGGGGCATGNCGGGYGGSNGGCSGGYSADAGGGSGGCGGGGSGGG